jgi:hypothetical protein
VTRARRKERGVTAVEAAIAVAVLGSLCAVAVPACGRELHASHFAEPIDGLARVSAASVAHAQGHAAADAFPSPAPLTPAVAPRGAREVDPAGVWDHPTWRALEFRASPENVPHAFAFAFDSSPGAFVAHAHGDLDGDGVTSTFEVRGTADESGARVLPGMYVAEEVE